MHQIVHKIEQNHEFSNLVLHIMQFGCIISEMFWAGCRAKGPFDFPFIGPGGYRPLKSSDREKEICQKESVRKNLSERICQKRFEEKIRQKGLAMVKVGIIGATGYAGNEISRLLIGRKDVELVRLGSRSYAGQPYAGIYRNFYKLTDAVCAEDDLCSLAEAADVIFTATPQGYCAGSMKEEVLSKAKVIDLSADFRIKDVAKYEAWYGIAHKSPQFVQEAVYGLCELNRDLIRNARLVANPGCYPTCSTLSVYPLLAEGLIDPDTIIIDAKSGVTGAGRGAKVDNLYCEVNESMKAYGVASHRHTPEIEDQLSLACGREVRLTFTPHLAPMNRGILVTAYASLKKKEDGLLPSAEEIRAAYEACYGNEFFIRLLEQGVCPETKWVEGSNYTDIGFKVDERVGRVIMMGALDNIVKGAAGQAVQNMNLMFGQDEAEGLRLVPSFP